ncbi:MAG TPA: hypothetical protein VJU85_01635 [Nitrososphaeraceae archaeon]|nr:hypothetical protein [Nitrososphaeraceae archaeon]
MGQIQNVVIIIIITVILAIVTSGLAYLFDLYLNPFFIIAMTYFHLLNVEIFQIVLSVLPQFFILMQ